MSEEQYFTILREESPRSIEREFDVSIIRFSLMIPLMTNKSAMKLIDQAPRKWISVLFAVLSFIVILLMPTPEGTTPEEAAGETETVVEETVVEGMSIEAHRLAAVTVFMAIFWLTQPVDIAVTSLVPIAFYPLLGILSAADVSQAYANHNVFLYLGGFAIAVAIEQCGLHKRMALHIISRVGSQPKQIVFGFMLTSAVLSMWISNTATTMMMLPIALALLQTLRESVQASGDVTDTKAVDQLTIPCLLGIAYAASIGGLSTFVGTPTNVSFLGYWDENFVIDKGYESLSMAEWMVCFVPLSITLLFIAGLVMTWGIKPLPNAEKLSKAFFRERLAALGKASRTERRVFTIFLTTALLWVFRKPLMFESVQVLPDWPSLIIWLGGLCNTNLDFFRTMVQDSTIAMAMASLLFLIPGEENPNGQRSSILTWEIAEKALPWEMILLIGSGFAMAKGFEETKLADWLGIEFANLFANQSPTVLILGVCLMVTFLTEFTTNVATVNTLLPTLAAMSLQLDIDPRMLLIPATVSASCAFMLPIATPPNAIIFGSGKVPISSMIRYGILLNIVGAFLVTAVTLLIANRVFGF